MSEHQEISSDEGPESPHESMALREVDLGPTYRRRELRIDAKWLIIFVGVLLLGVVLGVIGDRVWLEGRTRAKQSLVQGEKIQTEKNTEAVPAHSQKQQKQTMNEAKIVHQKQPLAVQRPKEQVRPQIPIVVPPANPTIPTKKYADITQSTEPSLPYIPPPKLLWMLTLQPFDGLNMQQALAVNNLVHYARKTGWEVRMVDTISAYEWLSQERVEIVKEAYQKSKVYINVWELLRLALLVEHGGMVVKVPDIYFTHTLEWAQELLTAGSCKMCDLPGRVFMLRNDRNPNPYYLDGLIYATKGSVLLTNVLNEVASIVIAGHWPYDHITMYIYYTNPDTDVTTYLFILSYLIDVRGPSTTLCEKYGLHTFDIQEWSPLLNVPVNMQSQYYAKNLSIHEKEHTKYVARGSLGTLYTGIARMVMKGIQNTQVQNQQPDNPLLFHGRKDLFDANSIVMKHIMHAEGNSWLLKPPNYNREVEFCIISLKVIKKDSQVHIQQSLEKLTKQTYQKWKAVYFVKEGEGSIDSRAKAVLTAETEGLNLQRAATKHCHPDSIGIILAYDQYFVSEKDLEIIAHKFQNKQVYGAFLSVQVGKQKRSSNYGNNQIRRITRRPHKDMLTDIANLFRVFTIQGYRLMGTNDLHDYQGFYFDREVVFLNLLEFGWDFKACEGGSVSYQVRLLQRMINLPKIRYVMNEVVIISKEFRKLTFRYQYNGKLRYQHLCESILFYKQRNSPIKHMAVLNRGDEFQGVQNRKHLPQRIPKIIHQIWVKGDIPPFKQLLMKKLRQMHPQYKYMLWGEANLTRQGFPNCYDMVRTLLNFHPNSPYSKMAMAADLMRNEIIYNFGGVYADTNYMVTRKNAFDDWLTFRYVTGGELFPRQRVFRDNAIFAAEKGYKGMWKVTDFRTINSRMFYGNDAARQTGPGLFSMTMLGEEELDPETYQPGFDELYPNFPYDPGNKTPNLCETSSSAPDDKVLFRGKRTYLKNCAEKYSQAFGLDFFAQGISWARRRW